MTLEEYIIKRKRQDGINEYDLDKRLENTRICVNYVFEYFNNYLETKKAVLSKQKQTSMKCLILAAGYATRLYPLTENFPKALLPVAGKTILDWLVDDLSRSGETDEYIVVSNHRYVRHFTKWAENKRLPITVLDDGTSDNASRLGAVRDILFALEHKQVALYQVFQIAPKVS